LPRHRTALHDAHNLALAQGGEKITPVEDTAVPAAGSVGLFDMVLAPLVHGFAHLLAEAGRRNVGGFAMDRSAVQPGTPESRMRGECATRVRSALPFDGRSLALNVAAVASAKPARHLFVGRADAQAMPIWIKSNECASKDRYTRLLLDWHASGSPSFVKPI